jgi:hypothetical protein
MRKSVASAQYPVPGTQYSVLGSSFSLLSLRIFGCRVRIGGVGNRD